MATINLYKLAKTLYLFIKTHGVVTRAALNREFKATSDQRSTLALNTVLKSLIHYGHLVRHAEQDTASVYFWVPGSPSPYTADLAAVLNPPDEDFLSLSNSAEPAANSVVPKPAEEDVKQTEPEEVTRPQSNLNAIIPEDLAQLKASLVGATTDAVLKALSQSLPFFTQDFVLVNFPALNPRVLSMRLSLLVLRGSLSRSVENPAVYWNPVRPVPAGYTLDVISTPAPRPKLQWGPGKKPVHTSAVASSVETPTAFEQTLELKHEELQPTVEDDAMFITGVGFVLSVEGKRIAASLLLSIKILKTVLQLNPETALQTLEESIRK